MPSPGEGTDEQGQRLGRFDLLGGDVVPRRDGRLGQQVPLPGGRRCERDLQFGEAFLELRRVLLNRQPVNLVSEHDDVSHGRPPGWRLGAWCDGSAGLPDRQRATRTADLTIGTVLVTRGLFALMVVCPESPVRPIRRREALVGARHRRLLWRVAVSDGTPDRFGLVPVNIRLYIRLKMTSILVV